MFKLLIKGNSVEAAEKSAAKFNVVLENPVLKSNPLGYDDVVALSDSPEKNIAEWFCNTTNVNVPFEDGALLFYSYEKAQNSTKEQIQEYTCVQCGCLHHGSIGAAGMRWTCICQTCKDKADNALLFQVKMSSIVIDKIFNR